MKENNRIEDETTEKAEGIGQQILGELEIIGGILTADPVTRSEGEFNVGAGAIHREVAHDLNRAEDESRSDD